MTASKNQVPINHLVASTNDESLCNGETLLGFFVLVGNSMVYVNSDSDNFIKLEGVISKITATEAHDPKDHEAPTL